MRNISEPWERFPADGDAEYKCTVVKSEPFVARWRAFSLLEKAEDVMELMAARQAGKSCKCCSLGEIVIRYWADAAESCDEKGNISKSVVA